MKPKSYWETAAPGGDPFQLPRRISQGLAELARTQLAATAKSDPVVRYIWIFVTEEGLRSRARDARNLQLEEWLNVIDESAALGAEWMVIHAGASLCQCPEVWPLCDWAQREHGIQVAIHLSSASLSEDDVERLTQLDSKRTFVVGDKTVLDALRPLRDLGLQMCEATVRPEDRVCACDNPKALACVGIDGRLFTCGLVLGDARYDMGNVLERGLKSALQDTSLPHAIPNTTLYRTNGCDGCPPHVANRVARALTK